MNFPIAFDRSVDSLLPCGQRMLPRSTKCKSCQAPKPVSGVQTDGDWFCPRCAEFLAKIKEQQAEIDLLRAELSSDSGDQDRMVAAMLALGEADRAPLPESVELLGQVLSKW